MLNAKSCALQIVADLPPDTTEALQALEYAKELVMWRADGDGQHSVLRLVDFTRPFPGSS